ncbi:ATP-binding protein [Priestia aryabhattai]
MKENYINPTTVDVTPSVRIYDVLRSSGFSNQTAMGELLDNAVDAGAEEIDVYVFENNGNKNLMVVDDGKGMSFQILEDSLKLAKEIKTGINELGKFGMGMKTAALSMSAHFEIYTKTATSDKILIADFNIKDIEAKGSFETIIREAAEDEVMFFQSKVGRRKKSGTIILIKNCDRLDTTFPTFVKQMETYIGLTYKNYIDKGIRFTVSDLPVRGERILSIDPLMKDDEETNLLKDREEIKILYTNNHNTDSESRIVLSAAIVPKPHTRDLEGTQVKKIMKSNSLGISKKDQGIYFYREGRMVGQAMAWTNLFGDKQNQKMRFRFEIDFKSELDNEIKMNYQKGNVEPNDRLKKQLSNAIQPILNQMVKMVDLEERELFNQRLAAKREEKEQYSTGKVNAISSNPINKEFLETVNVNDLFNNLQKNKGNRTGTVKVTDSLKNKKLQDDIKELRTKNFNSLFSEERVDYVKETNINNEKVTTPEDNYYVWVSQAENLGKALKSNRVPQEVKQMILESLGFSETLK